MVKYEYNPETNTIHVRPEGVLTLEDVYSYFERLLEDTRIQPGATERVYFQGLEDMRFDYKGTAQIVEKYADIKKRHKIGQTVFCVDSDMTYGMARMFQTIFEIKNHEVCIERVSRQ